MPITGLESTYKGLLITQIEAGILAECGYAVADPNCIDGLAKGIADATIPFLVANTMVNIGIPVTVDPDTGIGATDGAGTIS